MKDVSNFREVHKLDKMTFNELVFYKKILPFYESFLKECGSTVTANWTAKFYYGFFDICSNFSDGKHEEGVFVFEDLTYGGYQMGPRDKLDEKHITVMIEAIAKLHATSYAVKIQNRDKFDKFIGTFRAFTFTSEKRNVHDVFYDVAFERLQKHVSSTVHDEDFKRAVNLLYEKSSKKSSTQIQKSLDVDPVFNVILHGDYIRNNVMFKYDANGHPTTVKMFDFQLVKYASPVLDLSFCLYMNFDPDLYESCWDKILKFYHETLISSIAEILKIDEDDEVLQPFNFKLFLKHFSDYAFYGVIVTSWFLPIMLSDLETCDQIEREFELNILSDKAKEVVMPAGGLKAIERVTEIVKHAFKKGYLKRILE